MGRLKFSIRDILWLTVMVAVLLGWYLHDQHRLAQIQTEAQIAEKKVHDKYLQTLRSTSDDLRVARGLLDGEATLIMHEHADLRSENRQLKVQLDRQRATAKK